MNTIDLSIKNFLMGLSLFWVILAYPAEKVLIITHAHCRPDFIELQAKTFKAFLKDDYEYVVFNDASGKGMSNQLAHQDLSNQVDQKCQELGIRCFRVPQNIHQAPQTTNKRHAEVIQYSLESLGFDHNGIVIIIDSDMFLAKPFSAVEYLKEYNFIAGLKKRSKGSTKITHAAPTLVLMNMPKLPNKRDINFACGYVEGLACDVGGYTYYYFKNNPSVAVKLFPIIPAHLILDEEDRIKKWGHPSKTYGMEFYADYHFIHYYAGGCNWPGYSQEYHQEKTKILTDYLHQCMLANT